MTNQKTRTNRRAAAGMPLMIAALLSCPIWAAAAQAPYYRVFRGAKRADVSVADYRRQLNTVFVPALPKTHAKNGAVAYIPALPPEVKPAAIADEYALIAYESRKVYDEARATPEGQAYGRLHWTIFDQKGSKSGGAAPLGAAIAAETPYDLIGKPVDWQSGHSTFFAGTRPEGLDPKEFNRKLYEHVAAVTKAFGPYGLDGYVIVANDDYEAAWQHWTSLQAANEAFSSEEGKKIVGEAGGVLKLVQFAPALRWDARKNPLSPATAVNVLFQRREPPTP